VSAKLQIQKLGEFLTAANKTKKKKKFYFTVFTESFRQFQANHKVVGGNGST